MTEFGETGIVDGAAVGLPVRLRVTNQHDLQRASPIERASVPGSGIQTLGPAAGLLTRNVSGLRRIFAQPMGLC